ncbi:MAG: sugar ABC transporter ATP-binding protein, partial [Verrucomicrobia bacterium]
ADRFTVLRNGRVVAAGPATAFDEARLARCMTGRKPAQAARPDRPVEPRPTLLQVRGLRGGPLAEVSFDLHAGEVLGVTGLRGAGQSELAWMLFGLLEPRSGEIRLDGRPCRFRTPAEALAAGVACLPEDRLAQGLFLPQSVAFNLLATGLRRLRNAAGLLPPRRLEAAARHWLEALRIRAAGPDAPVQTLSGGNQQRVLLGRWLAVQPRLLIAHGPTAGVDIGSKESLHAKLRELAAQGLGVLVISDDLAELAGLCDRVLVLHRGRLVREWRHGELTEPALAACLESLR